LLNKASSVIDNPSIFCSRKAPVNLKVLWQFRFSLALSDDDKGKPGTLICKS